MKGISWGLVMITVIWFAGSEFRRYTQTHTLYRTSLLVERVEVASFRTHNDEAFNIRQCDHVRQLLQEELKRDLPNSPIAFWCD